MTNADLFALDFVARYQKLKKMGHKNECISVA
jgi:hypothetical protein